MARIDGVPPRPPYSFGHWMPANPALAFSASHRRRISNASFGSCRRQKPRSRHSAGRLASIQLRNSLRNCSSASLKVRSTSAVLFVRPVAQVRTERHSATPVPRGKARSLATHPAGRVPPVAVDPTGQDLKAFLKEDPGGPVVMLNLLRFK